MRPQAGKTTEPGSGGERDRDSAATPRFVALGGGTGLPNVLRGLRPFVYGVDDDRRQRLTSREHLVGIVATSDDGGSSGRLRAEFNVIPPGDRFGSGGGLDGLTIERHLGAQLFDYVIYDTGPVPEDLMAAYAARGARPIAAGSFELGALDRLGIQPIDVPLVSEHPAGKIRHHPDRLATVIAALAQGKIGAWRARPDATSP